MTHYEFTLRFRLPTAKDDPAGWLDRLHEAGCDDATVGVGQRGSIALLFTRSAASAGKALTSAIRDVRRAIPGAEFVAAEPDLVNLSDLGALTRCTRQNLRKYATGQMKTVTAAFPPATVSHPESLWRLAEVGPWLAVHTPLRIEPALLELARETSKANIRAQEARLALAQAAAE